MRFPVELLPQRLPRTSPRAELVMATGAKYSPTWALMNGDDAIYKWKYDWRYDWIFEWGPMGGRWGNYSRWSSSDVKFGWHSL